jgi:hypothetical protein
MFEGRMLHRPDESCARRAGRAADPRAKRGWPPALALALLCASCSSLAFERETKTSGTFRSSGVAVTLLSWDLPDSALNIARENAADSRLANLKVERTRVFPDLGPVDWLLDIVGVRYARVSGTWGSAE